MMLSTTEIILLVAIFFSTSIIGVVTGGNSLITVPALIWFGFDPRTAIATNMLALTLLSTGATIPFLKQKVIPRRHMPTLIVLTIVGSIGGALLVMVVPIKTLPLVISISMLVVAVFIVSRRNATTESTDIPTRSAVMLGYGVTLILGVYGGFFSGGYVTILTAAYIGIFHMSFVQAVATTKLINIFSSLFATIIFAREGLIDWELGLLLGAAMFAGATIGARITLTLHNRRLQQVFIVIVVMLALKMLIFDVLYGITN